MNDVSFAIREDRCLSRSLSRSPVPGGNSCQSPWTS